MAAIAPASRDSAFLMLGISRILSWDPVDGTEAVTAPIDGSARSADALTAGCELAVSPEKRVKRRILL